jgi:hypothetical protein
MSSTINDAARLGSQGSGRSATMAQTSEMK